MKRIAASAGFTLIEIIVVMSLLSVITLGLGTAMRSFASAEQRVNERILLEDDLRVTTGFLRRVLGRIAVKSIADPDVPGMRLEFSGAIGGLDWVGIMPARLGAGGLYRFHLAIEQDDASSLVLYYQPYVAPEHRTSDQQASRRVLVENISDFRLAYTDPENPDLLWVDAWAHSDRLPSHLRVSIQRGGDRWPDLVVALRPLLESEGGGGGAVFGPY